jgi:hypothetical protein
MKTKLNPRWLLSHFLNVRGVIFAVCLGNFIVRCVVVHRLDRGMQAYGYVRTLVSRSNDGGAISLTR